MSVPAFAPRPVCLIPDAPCHVQWHDQPTDDHSLDRHSIGGRHVEPSREVIVGFVGKGFAAVHVEPSGFFGLHDCRRRYRHSHFCRLGSAVLPNRELYHNWIAGEVSACDSRVTAASYPQVAS